LRAEREAQARDPDSEPTKVAGCFTLIMFSAIEEAQGCADAIAKAYPLSDVQRALTAELMVYRSDFAGALAEYERINQHNPWPRAQLMPALHRDAEASAIHRQLVPELFKQPLGDEPIPYPMDPPLVGASLLRLGATGQARTLIRHGLKLSASRPIRGQFGRSWSEVYGYTLLGDLAHACTALGELEANGVFVEFRLYAIDPLLAPLHTQPCFERHIAKMRAKAAAQVELARKAGLLPAKS
jgi:hypothetical protein